MDINKISNILIEEGSQNVCLAIGLRIKSPLEESRLRKGISQVVKKFPELDEIKISEDHANVSISKSTGKEICDQQAISLKDYQNIHLSFGSEVLVNYSKESKMFWDTVQDSFELYSFDLEHMDVRLIAEYKIEENHYEIFNNIFYKLSPLSKLFEGNELIDNDITLRGMIDDVTMSIVSVTSNQTWGDLKTKDYSSSLIKCSCNIGRISNFNHDSRFCDIFNEHCERASTYISDRFIPAVCNELNKQSTAGK